MIKRKPVKVAGKHKHSRGLRVLWLPGRGHKHTKAKHYQRHVDATSRHSIMASDSSPTAEYREFSYPPQGRSTPPPTTSYLSARQESQAIAVDPNVVKPVPEKETEDAKEKEHKDKEKDDVDMSAPDLNPGYKPEDRKNDKRGFKDDKGGGGGGDGKLNGKLETAFMLPLDAKDSDEESESCTVNCLYYTMQCCECTIT